MTIDDTIRLEKMLAEVHEHLDYEPSTWETQRHKQMAEWLKELKTYRDTIANAELIIKSIYGSVIVEGYADVFDRMKEICDLYKSEEEKANEDKDALCI